MIVRAPFLHLIMIVLLAVALTGCVSSDSFTPIAASVTQAPAVQATLVEEPDATIPPPSATPQPSATPSAEPTQTSAPQFDPDELKNMPYHLELLAQALPDSQGIVTLENGHFEQLFPDSASGVYVELVQSALGDLNGDGLQDAAVVLAVNTGGSGVFMYLVAAVNEAGEPVQKAVLDLGDRTRLVSLGIDGGLVHLDLVTHTPEDPLCCPTQEVSQEYALQGGLLVDPQFSPVVALAETVIKALSAKELQSVAGLVNPELGLRFSPYANVHEMDLVFNVDQISGLLDDPTVYTWGAFDGSGEPIEMTFAEYYDRFVYNQAFASADQISVNQRLGGSNTLDNSLEFYTQASPDSPTAVVEFYLPGKNPDYGGLDWASLRLVFQQQDGSWYLVGVIHDEWTV